MKNTFREYYHYSEEEIQEMRKEWLFVLDTNILLNFYRYSQETKDMFIKVLNILKNRQQLWIPYQVGKEFHDNRIDIISTYEKSYSNIIKELDNNFSWLEWTLMSKYPKHPSIDIKNLLNSLKEAIEKLKNPILNKQKEHPSLLKEDLILEDINNIFEGCVWCLPSEEEIKKYKKEWEQRYKEGIPPWFEDKGKAEEKKYGDVILWFQIIEKAKKSQKNIIFVSDDVKKDWWIIKDGEKIMPLPALKKEILTEAKVDFHIYTWDYFLKESSKYLLNEGETLSISTEMINEAKEVRENNTSNIDEVLEKREETLSQRNQLLEDQIWRFCYHRGLKLKAHAKSTLLKMFHHDNWYCLDIKEHLVYIFNTMEIFANEGFISDHEFYNILEKLKKLIDENKDCLDNEEREELNKLFQDIVSFIMIYNRYKYRRNHYAHGYNEIVWD